MQRFCGVSEQVTGRATGGLCQWPRGHRITISVQTELPGFSRNDLEGICEREMNRWKERCGLSFTMTTAATANIVCRSRRIDAQRGILAEAQLPCGPVTPATSLQMWWDTSEVWIDATNPPPDRIPIGAVTLHEFGHSLGLGHEETSRPSIMDPTLSAINTLAESDPAVAEVVARYGEAGAIPVPGGGDCGGVLECLSGFLRGTQPLRLPGGPFQPCFEQMLMGLLEQWLAQVCPGLDKELLAKLLELLGKLKPADRVVLVQSVVAHEDPRDVVKKLRT